MADDPNIITLAQAKKQLGLSQVETYDADLELYVAAATRVIEYYAGPQIPRQETLVFDGGRASVVCPWPFDQIVSVLENGADISSTVNASAAAGVIYAGTALAPACFAPGARNITVTVTVGTDDIPANVSLAARELVRFWWQQGRQGNRPAYGNEAVDTVDVPSGFAVPRRVVELLTPNRLIGGFA